MSLLMAAQIFMEEISDLNIRQIMTKAVPAN